MGVDGKMKQKSEFILLKDDILKQALNEKEKVIDKGFYADLYQTTLQPKTAKPLKGLPKHPLSTVDKLYERTKDHSVS